MQRRVAMILAWTLFLPILVAETPDHWAFQPISDPVPPRIASSWEQSPLDAFIHRRMRAEGLRPFEDRQAVCSYARIRHYDNRYQKSHRRHGSGNLHRVQHCCQYE